MTNKKSFRKPHARYSGNRQINVGVDILQMVNGGVLPALFFHIYDLLLMLVGVDEHCILCCDEYKSK